MPFLDTLCYLCLVKSRETLAHFGLDHVLRRAVRSSYRRSQAFYEPFRIAYKYLDDGYRKYYEAKKFELNILAYKIVPEIVKYIESRLKRFWELLAFLASTNSVDIPMIGYEFATNKYLLDIIEGVEKTKILARRYTDLTSLKRVAIFVDNAGETLIDVAILARLAERFGIEKLIVYARKDPYEVDVTYQDMIDFIIEMIYDVIGNVKLEILPRRAYPLQPIDGKIDDVVKADVVLVKGIANFECFLEDMREGLAKVYHEKTFMLFRAKCPVLASFFKVSIGTPIVVDKLFIEEVLGYG